MVTITRFKDPHDVLEMAPYFVVEDEKQRRQLVTQLTKALLEAPESVLVVQARKAGELVGFVITQLLAECSYVVQAWATGSWKIADAMWAHVQMWSVALGRNEIRAETKRDNAALFRRFGFEYHSTNVRATLDPELFARLARSLTDGRPIQNTEEHQPELTEPGAGRVAPAVDWADWTDGRSKLESDQLAGTVADAVDERRVESNERADVQRSAAPAGA